MPVEDLNEMAKKKLEEIVATDDVFESQQKKIEDTLNNNESIIEENQQKLISNVLDGKRKTLSHLQKIAEKYPELVADEKIQSIEEIREEMKQMTKDAIKKHQEEKKAIAEGLAQDIVNENEPSMEELEDSLPKLEDEIKERMDGLEQAEYPTLETTLDEIEKSFSADAVNTPEYQKFLKVKAKFLNIANINYLLDYRMNFFALPKSLSKMARLKDKKKFVNAYIADASNKLEKSRTYMFPSARKAYKQFLLAANNALERNAFYNFFIVLCHYILNRNLSAHAYPVLYTLNRMMMFKDEYNKEELELSSDILAESKQKKLNFHELKQSIIDNYSGDILKWKPGKVIPPSSNKVVKAETKSSLTVID
jgi:hypothetical protein